MMKGVGQNKYLITFLVIIILLLGGALSYFLGQQSALSKKVTVDVASTSPSPSIIPSLSRQITGEMTLEDAITTGTITGELGYPSEGIPPLEVYAISTTDSSKYFYVKTAANNQTFTIYGVNPGSYKLVAYAGVNYAGGYTPAVACGLSIDCKDHSLIPITVKAGDTNSEAKIRDWYASDGAFPPKPQ